VARIAEILERLGQMARADRYETVDYVGPARMVDLRRRVRLAEPDARMKGLRILVADDDLGIVRSLSEILRSEGCKVTTAQDGREALAKIESQVFDLVLTDVVMPHMDGYELFQEVHRRFPGLPVLMMTAFHYDKDHIIKRSRLIGLEGVIFKKPVDALRLRQAILDTVGTKE
jgi:two-component system response regulator GlrR